LRKHTCKLLSCTGTFGLLLANNTGKPKTGLQSRRKLFTMKKIYGLIIGLFFLTMNTLQAQINVEITYPAQQSGQYNYYGVKVTIDQALDRDITVNGYVYDDGSPNTNHPFSLTITQGSQTAETEWNFYQTCPACGAAASLSTISATYAGAAVVFDIQANMLKFNNIGDVSAVLNQLDVDHETYNANYESQYPNLTADQLDAMDEQNNFDQFKPFKDFERLFSGFYSKRAEVENIEIAWLANNFTGADPDETDLTFDDALNTIFNGSNSFKIGNSVYQLTASGMYIDGVLNEDVGTIALKAYDFGSNSLANTNYSIFSFAPIYNGPSYSFMPYGFEESLVTPCKSNKRKDAEPEFDNGNKRVKYKVSITSVAFRSGVGGKVVYYKKKNGNWKNARTDMAVSCAGTVYNGNCATSFQFSDRKPDTGYKKRNRISTRRHSEDVIPTNNNIWKAFSNQIGMSFDLSGLVTGNLALTF